ncbi:hypothetical protein [Hymenobacter sp. GOD-10R]|uniref:hypothetical protein n=1 Tax=Hymenobacter sp. GOD-10R TaxID=3093922 RepID=UPI002D7A16CE|nr:hypothetical protein [Hymenobacter sp. GOD-10R]WRQ26820.1 hypothetical protein SD425_17240 [Hymenobacter sp. GOD-10R]
MNFLRQLWSIRYYAFLALLGYGTFVWAGLTGTRLLGDDNESTENINGNSSSGGRAGHGTYYHK